MGAWYLAAILWVGGFITMVVMAITGRRQYVPGIVSGLAVGFVALFATCFANLTVFGR